MSKILLVDDDKEMLQLNKMVLEEEHKVFVAASGEKALEIIKEEKPELVLLDIMMPNMNGIEVLESIKGAEETASISVAMLTNLSDETYKKEALAKGAKKYLIKSDLDPDSLLKEIRTLI